VTAGPKLTGNDGAVLEGLGFWAFEARLISCARIGEHIETNVRHNRTS
jgi:hypothetical protein